MKDNPPPVERQMHPDEVPEVHQFSSDIQAQIVGKPFFEVKNAPFQGILYDESSDSYLVNPDEKAPDQAMAAQLLAGTINPEDSTAYLNQVRQDNPGLVAQAMDEIQNGDYTLAALKIASQPDAPPFGPNGRYNVHSTDSTSHELTWWQKAIILADPKYQSEILGNTRKEALHDLGQGVMYGLYKTQLTMKQAFDSAVNDANQIGSGKAFVNPLAQGSVPRNALAAAKVGMDLMGLVSSPLSIVPNSIEGALGDVNAPAWIREPAVFLGGILTGGKFMKAAMASRLTQGVGAILAGAGAAYTLAQEDPNTPAYKKFLDMYQTALFSFGMGGVAKLPRSGVTKAEVNRAIVESREQQAVRHAEAQKEIDGLKATADTATADVAAATDRLSRPETNAQVEAVQSRDREVETQQREQELTEDQRELEEERQIKSGAGVDTRQQAIVQPTFELELQMKQAAQRGATASEKALIQDKIDQLQLGMPEAKRLDKAREQNPLAPEEHAKLSSRVAELTAQKAEDAARSVQAATRRALPVGDSREIFQAKVSDIKDLTTQIRDAEKTGGDATALHAQRDAAIQSAYQHASDANMGKHEDQLPAEKAHVDAQGALGAEVQKGEFGADFVQALQKVSETQAELTRASGPHAWMTPILKTLHQEVSDARNKRALAQAHLEAKQETLARAQGLGDSERDRTLTVITNMIDKPNWATGKMGSMAYQIIGGASRQQNMVRIMAERVKTDIASVLGDNKEQWKQFRDALHGDIDPLSIEDIPVRKLTLSMQSFFSDMDLSLTNAQKHEVMGKLLKEYESVKDYFPLNTTASRERFESVLGIRKGPMSAGTGHVKPREMAAQLARDAAAEAKIHPALEVEGYINAIGTFMAHGMARAALAESKMNDGKAFFTPYDVLARNATGDKVKGLSPSSLAGLEGWVDSRGAQKMLNVQDPNYYKTTGLAKIQGQYKTLVMISPKHFWNQFSGTQLIDPLAVSRGRKYTQTPELMAEIARNMYVQPDRFIADAADRTIQKNPHMSGHLGFAAKLYGGYEHLLWTDYIRNLQVGYYMKLKEQYLAEGHSDDIAGRAAGHFAGQTTGITDPKMLAGWERNLQRNWLFAYIWNKKHITIPAQALPVVGSKLARHFNPELDAESAHIVERTAQNYLMRHTMTALSATEAASFMMSGHSTLDNEKGREYQVEWTALHDRIFGADGRRHYTIPPWMNFLNFYTAKAQYFEDAGPAGVPKAIMQNLANITMPLPSWAIDMGLMGLQGELDTTSAITSAAQHANPYFRDISGSASPLAQDVVSNKPVSKTQMTQDREEAIRGVISRGLGLSTSAGPRQQAVAHDIVLRHNRAVDLTLTLDMGIPIQNATPSDRRAAEAKLREGQGPIPGFNIPEFAKEFLGGRVGTKDQLSELEQRYRDMTDAALLKSGLSPEELDNWRGSHKPLSSILSSTQRRQFYQENPKLAYALDAASTDPNPEHREVEAQTSNYGWGLSQAVAKTKSKQAQLDRLMNTNQIAMSEWIKRSKDLRTSEANEIQGIKDGNPKAIITPAQREAWSKELGRDYITPAPDEQAYTNYRGISLHDTKYDLDDGTKDIAQWRNDQADFLRHLPSDLAGYVRRREREGRTPLELKYFDASDKYHAFKTTNAQWEEMRGEYDEMPPFERKMYMEVHPQLKGYFDYRQKYFDQNPDQAIFFHRQDQLKWNDWETMKKDGKIQEAYAMADWYVTAKGKHPEYLDPWQTKAALDPNEFGRLTKTWGPDIYKEYQLAIADFYQKQAADKATSRENFLEFLARMRARRRGRSFGYTQGSSVLGG
jgi:hypothetical protein